MRDAPIVASAFEPVEVSTTELLEILAVVVAAPVPRQHLRLDVGGAFRGEHDVGRRTEVGRRQRASAEVRRDRSSEVDSEPDERTVIVGGVGVVHRGQKIRVATIDAPAVVEKATLDGQNGPRRLGWIQWSTGRALGGHERRVTASTG